MKDCEDDDTVDKISLQFGNWLRAPPMISTCRASSSRNRNSESSVPSGEGEATEPPPVSEHDKHNPLIEDLQLTSDDVNLYQFEKEKNMELTLLRDASSGNDGLQRINESNGTGAIIIPDVPMNMDILVNKSDNEVRPDKQIKGSKQWKRLARGKMPLQPISAEGLLNVGNGKTLGSFRRQHVKTVRSPKPLKGPLI